MLALLVIPVVIVLLYIVNFYRRVWKYPRGPTPLPIVGNLLQFSFAELHNHALTLKKEYGPVTTVWQPHPVIYIQDFELIKEAFATRGDDYLGRNQNFPDTIFTMSGGVAFAEGEKWKEERRLALQILRDFGMGKDIMQEQVRACFQEGVKHIKSLPDMKRVDFRWPLELMVTNVINITLYGFHYNFGDAERLREFIRRTDAAFTEMHTNPLVYFSQTFPLLLKIPFVNHFITRKLYMIRDRNLAHVAEDVDKVLAKFDYKSEPECFAEAYAQRLKNDPRMRERLTDVCTDFFIAGSETTATTLRWAVHFMALNMNIQEKVREEIYSTVGHGGEISMSDRVRLPFTYATIHEIQRVGNIAALNLAHRTIVDTVCGDFKIPANTHVSGMIHTVLAIDPVWGPDPEKFRPERFLEKDGKTFRKEAIERFVPFSIGKRICAGESLARMELFIGFVILMQNFRIKPPVDGPMNTKVVMGTALQPGHNLYSVECL